MTEDLTALATQLEKLDEKNLKKLDKGLKDLQEFAQYGADEVEGLFKQVSNSSAFAVPFQVFTALLQQHPLTIEAIKDLVEIIKDPEFKQVLKWVGEGIGTLADLVVAVTKAIKRLVQMWLNLIAILKKMTTEPGGVFPSPPGKGLGGPWWWCSIVIGLVSVFSFL